MASHSQPSTHDHDHEHEPSCQWSAEDIDHGGIIFNRNTAKLLAVGGLSAMTAIAVVSAWPAGPRPGELESGLGQRWSPKFTMVKTPGPTVQQIRQMHALAQQKRWSRLFARSEHTGEANPSAPTSMLHSWQNDEGDFEDRSRPYDPADFKVKQVYEYVSSPNGERVSTERGGAAWSRLQHEYFKQKPSMTTYPAVPVVFNEDPDGGHAVASSPFEDEQDDYADHNYASNFVSTTGRISQILAPAAASSPSGLTITETPAKDAALSQLAQSVAQDLSKSTSVRAENHEGVKAGAETFAASHGDRKAQKALATARAEEKQSEKVQKVKVGDGKKTQEHVPAAVFAEAKAAVLAKAARELAKKEESADEKEGSYILGVHDTPHSKTAAKNGFFHLHTIEKHIIEHLEDGPHTGNGQDSKAAAMHRLQQKYDRANVHTLTKKLTQGETPEQAAIAKQKLKVKARALALLRAFSDHGL